ncbi:MAG: acyl-CoA dehydrogenase family protein [Kofleriaceae bacterium]
MAAGPATPSCASTACGCRRPRASAPERRLPHRPGAPGARAASTTVCAGSACVSASFELMCARAIARELGGGRPLASRQVVQAWIAEARADIDAARLMVLHAAWTIARAGFAAAREQVSLIKFHVADVMLRVVDRAIQVHGALGVTSDTVLAHFYAHERGARIYDGPDEVHKVAAAKRILARYGAASGTR